MNLFNLRDAFNQIFYNSKPNNRKAFSECFFINRVSLYGLSFNAKDLHHYGKNLSNDTIDKANEGDILFLNTYELPKFIKKYLPRLRVRIKLIIGNTDKTISVDFFYTYNLDIKEFLNNKYIYHIFAENCIYKHPKLTPIPIGIDYHKPKEVHKQIPKEQEQILLDIINKSRPLLERELKIFLTKDYFYKQLNERPYKDSLWAADRRLCINGLSGKSFVHAVNSSYPRSKYWSIITQYAFTACPCGNGPDTFRVWEVLSLGSIPVVNSEILTDSALIELYKQFPVLIVDRWDLLTYDMLNEHINKGHDFDQVRERLTMNYWKKLILLK